jgi:WD40 repeat protein/serine/threonine protein kinase
MTEEERMESGRDCTRSAEKVFARHVADLGEGESIDIGSLTQENPDLADELEHIHQHWMAGVRRTLGLESTASGGSGSPYGKDVDPGVSLEAQPEGDVGSSSSLMDRLFEHQPSVSRYRLVGEVARGGMGAILKVWDSDLRRSLAMKVTLGQVTPTPGETPAVDERTLGRFLEEAQVTGQLDHPGIVPVHELGLEADGQVFFTMRLVKGRDLKEIFDLVRQQEEGWTQTRALSVLLKVCEAMAYAHSKGVVHRDLKPANIMVGRFGEVYVMDWGLAKVIGREDRHDLRLDVGETTRSLRTERREERESDPDTPLMTMDGAVVGTPAYMPPEQARGEVDKLDRRSDVYSTGAMLYQLLVGHAPYAVPGMKAGPHAVWRWVLDGSPPSLRELSPDAPEELVAICEKAMQREPGRRYADMMELAEDLRAYLEGRVVAAFESGTIAELRKWIARNRALAVSSAAAAVFAVAGLGITAWVKTRANTDLKEVNADLETALGRALDAEQAAEHRTYTALLKGAQLAWEAGNTPEARRFHAACPEGHRGWEWNYLGLLLDSSITTLSNPENKILSVDWSPRGDLIATGAEDGTVCTWDWETGTLVQVVGSLEEPAEHVRWSQDGRCLGGGIDRGGTLRVWEVGEGLSATVFEGHSHRGVFDLSPDGAHVASMTRFSRETGTALSIASLVGAKQRQSPHVHQLGVDAVAWSPDGLRIATGSANRLHFRYSVEIGKTEGGTHHADDVLRVWDVESTRTQLVLNGIDSNVNALSWSPDSARVAAGYRSGSLGVWDVITGDLIYEVTAHEGSSVTDLAWSADGLRILTGSYDCTIRTWNAADGSPLGVLLGDGHPVHSVDWSPDGSMIVAATSESARIYPASGSGVQYLESLHPTGLASLALAEGGSQLLSSDVEGRMLVRDSVTCEVLSIVIGPTGYIAVDPRGGRLLSGGRGAYPRIWNLADRRVLFTLPVSGQDVECLAWSHDGALIALGGRSGQRGFLSIWNPETGMEVEALDGAWITAIAWGPLGEHVAFVSHSEVGVWHPHPSDPAVRILDDAGGTCIAWSPDASRIAAGSGDSTVRIWDGATGLLLRTLEGHRASVEALAWHPAGDRIVSASEDATLRVWDTQTWECVAVLDGREQRADTVIWSRDGTRIFAGFNGDTLGIWDSDRESALHGSRHSDELERTRLLVEGLTGSLESILSVEETIRTRPDLPVRVSALAGKRVRELARREASAINERVWPLIDPDRNARDTDVVEALELARTAAELDPDNAHIRDTLAWALFANGFHDDAVRESEKALAFALPTQQSEYREYLSRLRAAVEDAR